jgi:hypothetical protein
MGAPQRIVYILKNTDTPPRFYTGVTCGRVVDRLGRRPQRDAQRLRVRAEREVVVLAWRAVRRRARSVDARIEESSQSSARTNRSCCALERSSHHIIAESATLQGGLALAFRRQMAVPKRIVYVLKASTAFHTITSASRGHCTTGFRITTVGVARIPRAIGRGLCTSPSSSTTSERRYDSSAI